MIAHDVVDEPFFDVAAVIPISVGDHILSVHFSSHCRYSVFCYFSLDHSIRSAILQSAKQQRHHECHTFCDSIARHHFKIKHLVFWLTLLILFAPLATAAAVVA